MGQGDAEQGLAPTAERVPVPSRLRWRRGYIYILSLVSGGLLIFAAIYLGMQYFGGRVTSFEEFTDLLGGASWGFIALSVLLMGIIGSSSPLWPMPGSWASFIAAALAHTAGANPGYTLLIALAAGLGEPIGELSGYLVGYSGQVVADRLRWYNRIIGWMRRWGGITIFLLSAVPNFFTKLATVAAGALNYPLWRFFLFCWAGKTVKSLGFAVFGWAAGVAAADFFQRFA